ncbi:hypothetical protein M5K25_006095 [Dendrobium thyrsiflorum]|uniref:FAD/NAD(P)-binding domain-containing protein n=1 Tax=Dendrobium thyrsiflorum TaxID=117978 RepID=A0ABD0VC19_DENTH
MAVGGVQKSNRVVVVGGGIAGGIIAKTLQSRCEVTLIDSKEYLEIPWAQLRSMIEPSFAERTLIKHSEYLTNATIITSHATNVTNHHVQTDDGQTFPFDYLVVATGHAGSTKVNRKDRLKHFQQDYKKIKASNSILIIGGGPTGVELAGEIAVDFPEKKVTIVHKGPRLIEFIGPKASRKTFNWLIKKKVEVILEQTVDLQSISEGEGGVYVTSDGQNISADCHFVCVGKPVASSWLHDSILKQSLDKKGRLMVDANLRVKGRNNIFAIGDITDIHELKQGFVAEKHGLVVAKNLQVLMRGAPEKKLEIYTPSPPIAMVSLGRKEAVAQFPFGTLFGWVPGMIKSKDLFVGKTRKTLGLKST